MYVRVTFNTHFTQPKKSKTHFTQTHAVSILREGTFYTVHRQNAGKIAHFSSPVLTSGVIHTVNISGLVILNVSFEPGMELTVV